jgi:hypothetical protein
MRKRTVVLCLVGLALVALSASVAAEQQTFNILLVDDDWDFDSSGPPKLGGLPFYTSALDALGMPWDVWDVQSQGQPTSAALQGRDAVIWFTGYAWGALDDDPGVFTPANETLVADYLDDGGRFLLSSQEYYYDADAITPFMQDYLGVEDMLDVWVYTTTVGVSGNPIGDGLGPYTLVRPDDYGVYWPSGMYEGPYDDEVYARPEAGTPFRYNTGLQPTSSTNYETQVFKAVYLGWPFEWIDTVDQRAEVLGSILSWMGCLTTQEHIFLPLITYD